MLSFLVDDSDFRITSWKGLLCTAVGSILVVKIGLICLTAIYSLYFHPLRKIPGPKLWIAFPIVKSIAQLRGQLDFQIRAFHEKYGEVVRIGPDAVTFTSPQAWKDIYGHGHAELAKHFPRGTAHGDDGAGASDIISANARDHFRFRRAMLPAFSGKALEQQEPLIQVYVDLLVRRLREVAEAGEATDMVRWYTFTTFDLIGDLAYGEPFGGLESGKSNAWVESIEKMMKLFPILVLANTSPLLSKVFLLVAGSKIQNSRREHLQMVQRLAEKRIKTKCQARRGDFMDFLMRSQGQEHGLSNAELISNSDTLIVAGSETTATLLSGVTYHLLNSPAVLRRCVDEVRRAFGSAEEISFQSASASLPYMRACLDEALRLFPPIPTVLFRQTSPGPATVVDGLEVPEKTCVGVHHLSTYHSEANFHRAREFHPERWLSSEAENGPSPFSNDRRDAFKPFSTGPRDCIGRNLAYHEMRLILARVLWTFDLRLSPASQGWAEQQRTFALWEKPPLMVELTLRSKGGS